MHWELRRCPQKNKSFVFFGVSYNLLSKFSNLRVNGSDIIFILAQNINWPAKDKSGYIFTLVILHKNHFFKWPVYGTDMMNELSPHVDGREGAPVLSGRPERWGRESKILTVSPNGPTTALFWVDETFRQAFSRWGNCVETEVLSPALQLTNPGHCLEGAVLLVVGRWLPWQLLKEPATSLCLLCSWSKKPERRMSSSQYLVSLCHCFQFVPTSLGEKLKAML